MPSRVDPRCRGDYFFAFLGAFGFAAAPFVAFALARAFFFFSLPLVVAFFLATVFFLPAAFFVAAFFSARAFTAGASGAAGFASGAGRSDSGACFAIMTETDSDGFAPFRTQFANFSASTLNVDGLVSGS